MKNTLIRNLFPAAFALIAVVLAGGLSNASAQSSDSRVIEQAQRAVRQRILNQEGGRNATVFFNNDAQTDFRSRNAVRVRGTGTLSHSNDSSRYNGARSRELSYEATVNPYRSGSVSDVSYELRGRRDNDDGRDNEFGASSRPNGRPTYSGPILNRHSNKALDVTERSNRDGAEIQQWSYADQPNQNWEIIDVGHGESAIVSRQSGRVITVQGGRDYNGANIIQLGWRGTPQQRWRLERSSGDYYRIVSVDNGKCLDVTQAGKEDGADIQLWDCTNRSNQQWKLHR